MAYMKVFKGETLPNFLESAVGLVQKTEMVTQDKAVPVDDKKLIYGGTVFPVNDGTATGIVFETVDMTDDAKRPASVIKAGRIYGNRLKTVLSATAKTALEAKGFVILDAPEVEF
jgi:methionine synthase I (cobalamin-dependent)